MPAVNTSLRGTRVVVAGGGLAGLTAARELVARGADVHVIEPRNRLGGRVLTVRDHGFADMPLEAGGEFIDGEHKDIRALCAEYGLQLQRVLRDGFGLALDLRGRVQLFKTQRQIWSSFRAALQREADAFAASNCDWGSTAAAEIGRHSLEALLRARQAADEVRAMSQGLRGFLLAEPSHVSALTGVELSMQPTDPGHVTLSRIKGGNDRLVEKLGGAKGLRLSLLTEIKRVEHTESGASVSVVEKSGKLATIKADYIVMTAPAPVVRELEFSPALPSGLRQALKALTPGPATKAHALFDRAWWRKTGHPNAWGSNLDTGAIWEASGARPGVLTMLAGGPASDAFRELLEAHGPQRLVRRLSWLGDPGEVRDFRSTTWEMDRFARGGYVAFGPGFKPEWRADLSRAAGRVVFAGDHTSRKWQGYMNGAVESGIRAAREIETMRLFSDVQ